MAKRPDQDKQGQCTREERLDKIKSRINSNSEDAANLLKMWLNKEITEKDKKK
tara:strand:- start:252 stop:410 length:159 start_codon:yes stop_codon:yes gene_type:complete